MSKNRRSERRLARWIPIAVGTALIGAVSTAPKVSAQEASRRWVQKDKARIGVMLEEVCENPPSAEVVCDRPPVVSSVVVDGPADQAGVRARDTLLSVNGLDVTRPEGRGVLLGLQAGVPVRLEVGREGGRQTIDVTPEVRPPEPYVEVRTFFADPAPAAGETGERVQILRVPSVRRGLDELEVRLDSLQTRGEGFVFFQEDSDGTFTVEVADSAKAHVILERMRESLPAGSEVGVSVWENEELARRLARVRDSSLKSARVHLDSLIRLRGQVRRQVGDSLALSVTVETGSDPEGRWSYYVAPRDAPSPVQMLFQSDFRVGGAEFRELSESLAEYFEGVDEGLLALRVLRDTPAYRMGLRDGDVVVEVNGEKCTDIKTLRRSIADTGPGRPVEVKWVRKGKVQVGELEPS
jgi:C-terminal processing protease CtpA/Prc